MKYSDGKEQVLTPVGLKTCYSKNIQRGIKITPFNRANPLEIKFF